MKRCRRALWGNTALFLVFFLAFVIRTLLADGYAVRPETGEVFMEPYKYLTNFLQMPVVLLVFLVGGCALGHYPHAVEAGIRQGYLVCRCRDGAYGIGTAACGRL